MKNLFEILNYLKEKDYLIETNILDDSNVRDITFDSREVKKGTLFFCKGLRFNEDYLKTSIDKGAIAYISEKKYIDNFPYIIVKDIRIAMLDIAKFFFDSPDERIKLIGVTGTKGKSTTVGMIKSILDSKLKSEGKLPCGIISSILTYDGVLEFESHLTTPEAINLYKHINNAVKSGLEYMVIEISSQALKYNRINNVAFDVVCLTNIGIDHIGSYEHPTIEDYIDSKLKIFDLSDNLVYSIDGENIEKINKNNINNKNIIKVSTNKNGADYLSNNIVLDEKGSCFSVNNIKFSISLLGKFNIENALIAIAVGQHFGISLEEISTSINDNLKSNSELLKSNDGKLISFVNYAHNKISFEKNYELIKTLYPQYKIISVFGASGGKGLNRRKDLTLIAQEYSYKIFFAPDDPNFDDPIEIAKEMSRYFTKDIEFEIFETREEAIIRCFEEGKVSNQKLIFFIAGKSDESYQLINGEYVEINSDIKVARREMDRYNNL